MARQRLVKPDVFQHEELHRAETSTGLPIIRSYIGLWTQCDRRGCFDWRPGKLKANITPFDSIDFADVLTVLEEYGFCFSYVVDGKRFGCVPSLPAHQTFNVHEKANPLIPDPPETGSRTSAAPVETGSKLPGSSSSSGTSSSAGSSSAPIAPRPVAARASTGKPAPTVAGGDEIAAASIRLTRAANHALTAKFGEQPDPIISADGRSYEAAETILASSIPLDFAESSIARQVQEGVREPIRTLTYFVKGVKRHWAGRQEHFAAAAVAGAAPLPDRPAPNKRGPKSFLEVP